MSVMYRCVKVNGQRFVECPQVIWDQLEKASATNPEIPKPALVDDPIFKKRRDPTKTYYSKGDMSRLARGEAC